ncbi:hypothetical protein DID88_004338 [Monilinia fructigena]|uniref:RNase H type-1 domain-containing protein n=1 Tax=Monilinia fructigena TaxID=38457 RepID=A0A395ISY1_9HELO|nr:hypothetical protein DID88_004338 [Monilinia fructigena]
MDLVAAFVHDVECAFARKREVTLVTMDVQGSIRRASTPTAAEENARPGLAYISIENDPVVLTGAQGDVLYMLYLAELLNQDQALRFGYADDIALYRVGKTLEDNIKAITRDVQQIEAWGSANKVAFAPEKLEMMHFTRRRHIRAPEAVISPTLTIRPTTSAPGDTKQPALRSSHAGRHKTAISGPAAAGSTTPDPIPPHYTPGCRIDPTMGIDKETAAASFTDWWNALPPNTITIFSDGSESYDDMGKHVGYGYAIYQGQTLAATGKGAINTLSHVFDAEAIGALKGLQKALTLPSDADTERWLCIDSTSVIWCKRANASDTSQWAFLESHRLIDRHAVNIRWSPGHQGIIGNEAADELADAGAKSGIVDPGLTTQPTISGIGSIARGLARNATSDWWYKNKSTLSGGVPPMATRLRFEGAYRTPSSQTDSTSTTCAAIQARRL